MSNKLELILKAVPTIIMWELWKRRNVVRNGKEIACSSMHYQYLLEIHQFIRFNSIGLKGYHTLGENGGSTSDISPPPFIIFW